MRGLQKAMRSAKLASGKRQQVLIKCADGLVPTTMDQVEMLRNVRPKYVGSAADGRFIYELEDTEPQPTRRMNKTAANPLDRPASFGELLAAQYWSKELRSR